MGRAGSHPARFVARSPRRRKAEPAARDVQEGRIIKTGTRVRLRPEPFASGRPHLLWHARQRDVGVVVDWSPRSPAMVKLFTIVRFDECGRSHRLLESELEPADR